MSTAMEKARMRLANVARLADCLDDTVMRDQAVRSWEEAGGFARWSDAGNPLYRRADGRSIRDRDVALSSYIGEETR